MTAISISSIMNHQYYKGIGVMSGTSLDGIDLAHIELIKKDRWTFHILEKECIPYSSQWKARLQDAITLSKEDLQQLNVEYTALLSTVCKAFIARHKIQDIPDWIKAASREYKDGTGAICLEPNAIMEWFKARSFRSNFLMYRINSVSLW